MRILVVEDERRMAELLRQGLMEDGHAVTVAVDGREGLAIAESGGNLKGGEIKTISKEVEKGVTQYEVESRLNGKHRDFNVDSNGKLIGVEEEVDIASIPAGAKAAIEKKLAGGKLGMVETVTKSDGVTLYEAAYTSKAGKKGAVLVKPDGTETKD